MDDKEFQEIMSRLPGAAPQITDTAAPAVPDAQKPEATQPDAEQGPGDFADILQQADQLIAAKGAASEQTGEPDYSRPPQPEPALGDPSGLDAIAGGALKSIFESGDFLFGETAPEDRSEFRHDVERTVDLRREQSLLDGFAAGVGQFATTMVGLGKAKWAAEALPWVGRGLGYVGSALPKTMEVGKAALAGAIGFDPHEERLSNLVQDTPLANPVSEWLSAQPGDTAAEGRLKAAMESIGLDAAVMGTFFGAGRVWKALRAGHHEEASRLVDAMEADKADHLQAGETVDIGAAEKAQEGAAKPAEPIAPAEAVETPPAALAPDESTPQTVPQSAPAAAPESTEGHPVTGPAVTVTDEQTTALLDSMAADAGAINNAGGWYQAIAAGHTFGRGEGVPYAKLAMGPELDDFMARLVDATESQLDHLKGGAVMTDEAVDKAVKHTVDMFNADPAETFGLLRVAGDRAAHMVANMEAGYLVANRMLQDSFALATRIRLGDYSQYGSRAAAMDALKHQLSLASSVYGAARSITSMSGRAMRRMRMEFRLDPAAVDALETMDGERMVQLLVDTGGDPRALGKIVGEPTLWERTKDFGSFLVVNGLVSSPKTQFINALSNGYMVLARPLERIVGAVIPAATGNEAAGSVLKDSLRQYTYLGAAFTDAFASARRAFLTNDSVLSPHQTEAYAGNRGAARAVGHKFKPWDNPGNMLHNALVVATPAIGLPTRALGFTDELTKQTVYRSKVLAAAHTEAAEAATELGLKGKELREYVASAVRTKLDAAFDSQGRGLDEAALREANIATFQQELAPGSIGKWVQLGAAGFFPLRLIFPFVKTPTNILRYGWKMTPGLNLAQREFRDAILGKMGAEAKAQATGQMMLGGLFMGAASFLVSQGTITGGGPKQYQARQALMATGWQPYSVVVQNEDGSKTYIPFGRIDPAAMPFGIVADLMDALHVYNGEETPDIGAAIGGLLIALSRQFTSKSYLTGASQALDALSDPDARMAGWAGGMAANFIPYSAALRQFNPDPNMHEARELADRVLATVPGLSESLPPTMDAWGDPVVTRKGLWSTEEDQLVDREIQRLILESGAGVYRAQPVHNGIDLRDITMADGSNAYVTYQTLAGHPPHGPSLKAMVAKRIASSTYQMAPDGAADVKGTKLWMLHPVIEAYRTRALAFLKRDPVVRDAFRAEALKVRRQWLEKRAAASGSKAALQKIGGAFGADLGGHP